MRTKIFLWIGLTLVIGIIIGIGCGGEKKTGRAGVRSDVQEAAIKSYVAPGDLDEYYIFKSGGHSGQVYVYGIPRCATSLLFRCSRLIRQPAMALTRKRRKCSAASRGAMRITPR